MDSRLIGGLSDQSICTKRRKHILELDKLGNRLGSLVQFISTIWKAEALSHEKYLSGEPNHSLVGQLQRLWVNRYGCQKSENPQWWPFEDWALQERPRMFAFHGNEQLQRTNQTMWLGRYMVYGGKWNKWPKIGLVKKPSLQFLPSAPLKNNKF